MSRWLRREEGFTLAEILVTLALCVTAMATFYAASGQAIRLVRAGKESASANQLLQQRLESFHSSKLWKDGLSPDNLKPFVALTQPAVASLPGAAESYTVSGYPSGTPSFTVSRGADGKITTSGTTIPKAQKCVKIAGQITWKGAWSISRTHTQATILSRGGL